MVDAGLTHQQIADRINEETGQRVSRSTVSVALSRAGLAKDAMRYKSELPWKVKAEHLTQYPARMLRLLGRRNKGIELTDEEAERLEAWLEGLNEKGLVTAYAPDVDGFIYVANQGALVRIPWTAGQTRATPLRRAAPPRPPQPPSPPRPC
jgi:hypothetical protein